jgi:thiamine kinase-like enzyme
MNIRNIEEQTIARKQYEIIVCQMALEHYGLTTQTVKCIEELAELQVELAKTINLDHRKDQFRDEMVDAEIMLSQMKLAYFHSYDDYNEYQEHLVKKLKALECRIKLSEQEIQKQRPSEKGQKPSD